MDFVPYEGVDSTLVGEPVGQVAYAELAPPESWYGEVTSPRETTMASEAYELIKRAIQDKEQVVATYQRHCREMCPHILGVKGRRLAYGPDPLGTDLRRCYRYRCQGRTGGGP